MRRLGLVLSCVSSVLLAALPAAAATVRYTATLSGAAEVPPNASPGTGSAVLDIVDEITMSLTVTFSGLTGSSTAAHIHNGPATGTGGVMTQTPFFVGFPIGVSAGSFAASFLLDEAPTWSPAFVTSSGGTVAGAKAAFLTALADGNAYFNLHSTTFPGGEIRGQMQAVAAVPLPAGAWLALGGLAALGLAGQRRTG